MAKQAGIHHLSIKIHFKLRLIDRWAKRAQTEESTPPLNPKTTFFLPAVFFIFSIASLVKDFIVHEGWQRQILKRKFAMI